ncbi:MAG: NAD(P)/FAD-dependent oxidoreductase [Phycisphaerales bacterium]
MGSDRHAVVLGGAAAGATAGLGLARAGWCVTIIESARFPRAKVCGEFVSPAVTALLESLIPAEDLLEAGARRVRELTLWLGQRRRDWPMHAPAWAISRRSLDDLLLARARQEGARVLQPERASGVSHEQGRVAVTLASGERIEADIVVHADGRGRLDAAGPTPTAKGIVGLKCHAELPMPLGGIHMRAARGAYAGGIDVEHGLATIALCATHDRLRDAAGDRDALLADLWPGYEPAWRRGEWLACGVARSGYRRPSDLRSFRVGNAAAAVDPVGGEGIGLAIWSACILAESLRGLDPRDGAAIERLHRGFATAYHRRLRTRRPACRLAAELLMRPRLLAMAWPLLAAPRLTIEPWYRLTGKPALTRA